MAPIYRQAWAEQGWERESRVPVSRSVLPITEEIDRRYFGDQGHDDQVGLVEGVRSRFGRTFVGEPDKIAQEFAADEAARAADTILFAVPDQLGVGYNTWILDTIARYIAPAVGWTWNITWLPSMPQRAMQRVGLAGRGVAVPRIRRNVDVP